MTSATLPETLPELGLRVGRWEADVAHSAVLFSVRHLGLARVRGRFDRFEAVLAVGPTLAETRIEATIELASIDTNNADRDGHLRSLEILAAERHPAIRFASTGIAGAGAAWRLSGDLTLNGVSRPVGLEVAFHGIEEYAMMNRRQAGFTAAGIVRRSDFGLDYGLLSLPGGKLALGDEVAVELEFEFVEPAAR